MTVGNSLRSSLRVLIARPASVLPVYLLVIGLTATTRVPILIGLAAAIGLLVADGRLDALRTELEAFNPNTVDDSSPEAAVESVPAGLQQAVFDIVSVEIIALLVAAAICSLLVSIVANSLGNAAAINGIYSVLYDGDGIRDAVVGLGRDWKSFVGITLAKLSVIIFGLVPVALGASLFVLSTPAGIAATLVGFVLSMALVLVGLLLLAFAEQSIVVDGVGFGTAVRRSAGFPFRQPTPFVAYIFVALGVFGALGVLSGLFNALGVSQLSGILGPLLAIPFVDAFKTTLYTGRPVSSSPADDHQPSSTDQQMTDQPSSTDQQMTDGGERSTDDETHPSATVDEATLDGDNSSTNDDHAPDNDQPTGNGHTSDDDQPTGNGHTSDDDQSTSDDARVDAVASPAVDSPADSRPAYRHRFVGAFRDGLTALAEFIRRQPVPILVAAVLFGLATVGGWQLTGEFAVDLPATEDVGNVFGAFPLAAFVMIAANNWLVSATAIYGGVAFGIPTALDMLLNGFIVGAVYGIADPVVFAALVAPHGVIELPAIIVAGGLGFHLAVVAAGVVRGTRTAADLAEVLQFAYRVLLGLAVVLVIASFVEAFLTPAIAEFVLT